MITLIPEQCPLKKWLINATKVGRRVGFEMNLDHSMNCHEVNKELQRLLLIHENIGYGCIRGHSPTKLNKEYCSKCHCKETCEEIKEHDKKLLLPPSNICLSCPYYS